MWIFGMWYVGKWAKPFYNLYTVVLACGGVLVVDTCALKWAKSSYTLYIVVLMCGGANFEI